MEKDENYYSDKYSDDHLEYRYVVLTRFHSHELKKLVVGERGNLFDFTCARCTETVLGWEKNHVAFYKKMLDSLEIVQSLGWNFRFCDRHSKDQHRLTLFFQRPL